MHLFGHFRVVVKHKWYVFKYSIKAGIPFKGLIHDTSKYSITEFVRSAKYFDGTKSPTIIEREFNDGVSMICMHHSGRNKHHWQYWLDYERNQIVVALMPYKNSVEFVCDMLAASKTYQPKEFSFEKVLEYFNKRIYNYLMHPASKEFVRNCLDGLCKEGFKYIKKKNTKKIYFDICKKYDKTYFIPITKEQFDVVKVSEK